MNIIVKPIKEIKEYIEHGINTFLLPLEDYSVEYDTFYSLDEIKEIIKNNPSINVFVNMNKNIMNEEIESVKEIMKELNSLNISGIFFYDSALIKIKEDLGLNINLVWAQTHMVANYNSCNYYYDKGVKYALLSKEITKDEIIEIINKSKITAIVELFTKPSIAFSKRKLVSHYFENYDMTKKEVLSVNEKISNTNLIVKENNDGVVFKKNSILNGFYILGDLIVNGLEYILVNEDFIEHDIFMKIIDNINYYISNYNNIDKNKFLEEQIKLFGEDSGFFFKKTIYRVKK